MVDKTKKVKGPIYITKWATTKGILVAPEGEIYAEGRAYFVYRTNGSVRLFVGPNDYAFSMVDARVQVHKKIRAQIKAAERAKARLESMLEVEPAFVELKLD